MANLPNKPAEYTLPKRLPLLLRHAWYGLNQTFRRRIAHLGLTPDQFTVLRNLFEEPGLTQRELCSRMASDPNTVAALTARMEAEGWIERVTCKKDRRANRLRLLPPGKKKFTAASQIALSLQIEVSEFLAPAELDVFLENLSQLAKSCRVALRHSPPKSGALKRKTLAPRPPHRSQSV